MFRPGHRARLGDSGRVCGSLEGSQVGSTAFRHRGEGRPGALPCGAATAWPKRGPREGTQPGRGSSGGLRAARTPPLRSGHSQGPARPSWTRSREDAEALGSRRVRRCALLRPRRGDSGVLLNGGLETEVRKGSCAISPPGALPGYGLHQDLPTRLPGISEALRGALDSSGARLAEGRLSGPKDRSAVSGISLNPQDTGARVARPGIGEGPWISVGSRVFGATPRRRRGWKRRLPRQPEPQGIKFCSAPVATRTSAGRNPMAHRPRRPPRLPPLRLRRPRPRVGACWPARKSWPTRSSAGIRT